MASVAEQIVTNANYSNSARIASNNANSMSSSTSSVSSQEFLYLLTQQLQYQDPMNPMDNSEMLAQEAQFSTLEQMEALTSSFSKFSNVYQANSLLGQTVEVTVDGKETKGTVDYVDFSDNAGASVSIGGKMYPLDSVSKVYPQSEKTSEERNFFVEAVSNIANNLGYIAKKIYDSTDGKTEVPNTGDIPNIDTNEGQ